MLIKFKNLIIHNFLSYGHCEIDLTDRHYCLVSGVNNDQEIMQHRMELENPLGDQLHVGH